MGRKRRERERERATAAVGINPRKQHTAVNKANNHLVNNVWHKRRIEQQGNGRNE